jgi:hypothetical protein
MSREQLGGSDVREPDKVHGSLRLMLSPFSHAPGAATWTRHRVQDGAAYHIRVQIMRRLRNSVCRFFIRCNRWSMINLKSSTEYQTTWEPKEVR